MSVNPDIHETRKMLGIAQELIEWVDFGDLADCSHPDFTRDIKNAIIDAFYAVPAALMKNVCPLFLSYMINDCSMNVYMVKWSDLTLALSNVSGEYDTWASYKASDPT